MLVDAVAAAAAPPYAVPPSYDGVVLAACSRSTTALISVRIMIRNSLSRRQHSPYVTCAAAGLTVFGGCTDIARGSKVFDLSVPL